MHLRALDASAAADLAVTVWFMDAHKSVHTHTLNPKAATVGDYEERKWLLKCLSPTHIALDREKVWITGHQLLQSFSIYVLQKKKLNRATQTANFAFHQRDFVPFF